MRPEDLNWKMLWVEYREKYPLRGKEVLRYIEKWGEKIMKCHENPTCMARKPWWWFGKWEPADQILPKRYSGVLRVPINSAKVLENNDFYGITYKRKDYSAVKAFLNSVWFWLNIEVISARSLGLGVLELRSYELVSLPIIDNRKITPKLKARLRQSLETLSSRPIGGILEETELSDRRELDLAVLEALGFEDEQERERILEELYAAVCDLVKNRLEKAKSLKEKKKDGKNREEME